MGISVMPRGGTTPLPNSSARTGTVPAAMGAAAHRTAGPEVILRPAGHARHRVHDQHEDRHRERALDCPHDDQGHRAELGGGPQARHEHRGRVPEAAEPGDGGGSDRQQEDDDGGGERQMDAVQRRGLPVGCLPGSQVPRSRVPDADRIAGFPTMAGFPGFQW
ncbi:hypothetical protein GCM10018952_34620 [Streptosporangium vulgare]